ncbi:hypothetical protein AB9P05_08305 [Roseivirga sp. BDSF3-8]|uniref:hypothetical protein n=1 Tax=Roseivirga sp. BDSF3-8 TaxID=3241598 RepID=UPI003532416E
MRNQLDIAANLSLVHGDETVTLSNDEKGNLILNIPSQKTFREITTYNFPQSDEGWLSSLKQWNTSLYESGVILSVQVETNRVLTLGQDESPYINYLSLAGDYLKNLFGR